MAVDPPSPPSASSEGADGQSRSLYQEQFFALSHDLLAVIDFEGRFVEVNPRWEELLGWSREELLGRSFMDLVHPDDVERTRQESHRLDDRVSVSFENRYVRRDGGVCWLAWRYAVSQEQQLFYSVARDVTAERLSLQEAERGRKMLEMVLENIQDGVVATDRDSNPLFINQAMIELIQKPDGSIGDNEDFRPRIMRLNPVTHQREPVTETPTERALRGETVVRELLVGEAASGQEKIIEVSATPIRDDESNVNGTVITAHDVTEQHLAEQAKSEFLALVSHELRTPLTSVLGYLDLFAEETEAMTPEARSYLGAIQRNSNRLMRLIGDLLFTAQMDHGMLMLSKGEFDPVQLSQDAWRTAQLRASDKQIQVDLELEEGLAPCWGDCERLSQALDNLISNAIKFTPSLGRIVLRVARRSQQLVMEVSDNGPGIPEQEQATLFERFSRGHQAMERALPGVGLGLAISKAIVEGHNGTISLDSTLGEGTTVRIEIPYPQHQQ